MNTPSQIGYSNSDNRDEQLPVYFPYKSNLCFPRTCVLGPIISVLTVELHINLYLIMLFWLQKCIVLDIEGTTTPISFVTEMLFPYARDNVGRHLALTYETPETKDDIKLLRSQVRFMSTALLTV